MYQCRRLDLESHDSGGKTVELYRLVGLTSQAKSGRREPLEGWVYSGLGWSKTTITISALIKGSFKNLTCLYTSF